MSEINNGMGQGTGNPVNPVPNDMNKNTAQQDNKGSAPSMRNRSTSVTENKDSGKNKPVKKAVKKEPKPKKKRKEHKVLRRIGIVICSFMLIGLISVSSVGIFVLKNLSDFVNGDVAIDLDEYKSNQSQTTILYTVDDTGKEVELIRLHGEENRIWVDLDEMPEDLQNAFIALEDMRFRKHAGVDWKRTISVAILPSNKGEGGSTITQQLIKNLTGERDVTYIRKFREIQKALFKGNNS